MKIGHGNRSWVDLDQSRLGQLPGRPLPAVTQAVIESRAAMARYAALRAAARLDPPIAAKGGFPYYD